jgi:hypothetical protein
MSTTEFNSLREKIDAGVQLAVKKLREKTKLEGGELIVSKHGKIVRLQAKDITAS